MNETLKNRLGLLEKTPGLQSVKTAFEDYLLDEWKLGLQEIEIAENLAKPFFANSPSEQATDLMRLPISQNTKLDHKITVSITVIVFMMLMAMRRATNHIDNRQLSYVFNVDINKETPLATRNPVELDQIAEQISKTFPEIRLNVTGSTSPVATVFSGCLMFNQEPTFKNQAT